MAEHEAPPGISLTPHHWRVQACRWLWHRLGFIWGILGAGIVVGTAANLSTTTTNTPLTKLYIVHFVQTYPLLFGSVLGLGLVFTFLVWLGKREEPVISAQSPSPEDRIYILRHLRMRYEQLRNQSLQRVAHIELGLAAHPAAVQNAVSLALRIPDQLGYPLPAHTSIIDVYKQAKGELLILGEPGAGKSTLLQELAFHLLLQAEQDTASLLPVYLPLATWAKRKRSLDEWLGEEIVRLYEFLRNSVQQWIAAKQILPLLDGLDEMEEDARPECVVAINAYHRASLRPLVVCSRTGAYDIATNSERLALHMAVVVQPLDFQQVDDSLVSLGEPLAGLQAALSANPLLKEVATTPLMFQVLLLAYHGVSVQDLPQHTAQLRARIWADYVQRMVRDKGDTMRYPLDVTINWLGWLALKMRQMNLTIFSLESLQMDWLPPKQRKQYRWNLRLVVGGLAGLVVWLFFGVSFGLADGLFFGVSRGLFYAMIAGLLGGLSVKPTRRIEPEEALAWSWKKFREGLFVTLFFTLLSAMGGALGSVLGILPPVTGTGGMLSALPIALLFPLFFGLQSGFSGQQIREHLKSSPNEGIHRALRNGLFVGLTFALVAGLLFGLVSALVIGLTTNIVDGLFAGLIFGLAAALLWGWIFGSLLGVATAIRHYLLRFWLVQSGNFPRRAIPFLEDATARILLRRVGGGYSFAHRLLLDYFADLRMPTPLIQEAVQAMSTSVTNESLN